MSEVAPKGRLAAVHPVLPSRDVGAAVRYYVDRLGFRLRFTDDPQAPRYAGVGRDDVELHLQWSDPSEWSGDRPMYRFVVAGLEALFDEYGQAGVFHPGTALRRTAWGTDEFAFYDGDGNGLTFYRDIQT